MRNLKSDLFRLACVVIGVAGLLMIGEMLIDEPQLLGRPLTSWLAALFGFFGFMVFLFSLLVRRFVRVVDDTGIPAVRIRSGRKLDR